MPRARATAFLLLVSFLAVSFEETRAAAAPPPASTDYSPLPPPPPPPTDPGRTVLHPLQVAPATTPTTTPTSPAPLRAVPPTPTTTTSAVLPSRGDPQPLTSPVAETTTPPRRSTLDDDSFSIAPLLGFASDNLDLGVGVRAGATAFAPHLWVGGTFVYHLGTSTSGTLSGVRYASSSSAFYAGPEVGYDFELGPVVLRPYGGIGLAAFTASATTAGITASDTVTKLVIWPGATVLYGLPGSRFFVGADTRFVTIPGGPAVGLFALGGMTL